MSWPWRKAVHPRLCGDRWVGMARRFVPIGSSPPVRGSVPTISDIDEGDRFIPACAGIGPPVPSLVCNGSVHPRLCGDRCVFISRPPLVCGSSPPVRGSDEAGNAVDRAERFIPACAGIGCVSIFSRSWSAVHPRLCGDRASLRSTDWNIHGSSPPVRGSGVSRPDRVSIERFIPACAGIGRACLSSSRLDPVHPRLCGDRLFTAGRTKRDAGSSPPVRGSVDSIKSKARILRFIPACAGIGSLTRSKQLSAAVHPRLCGDRHHGRAE